MDDKGFHNQSTKSPTQDTSVHFNYPPLELESGKIKVGRTKFAWTTPSVPIPGLRFSAMVVSTMEAQTALGVE